MIQSVLGVLRRLPNTRSYATAVGTLKTKGPSPKQAQLKGTDNPDCFQRIASPPKAPPDPELIKATGDPSLDKDLLPRIAALFGPSRRAPLKPTQPSSTP